MANLEDKLQEDLDATRARLTAATKADILAIKTALAGHIWAAFGVGGAVFFSAGVLVGWKVFGHG